MWGKDSPVVSRCSIHTNMAWRTDFLILSLLGLSLPTGSVLGGSCNDCQACAAFKGGCDCYYREHKEYVGGNLNNGSTYRKPDWQSCRTSCEIDFPTARFFTQAQGECWCFSSNAVLQGRSNVMSGDLNTCTLTTTTSTTTTTTTTITGPQGKIFAHI